MFTVSVIFNAATLLFFHAIGAFDKGEQLRRPLFIILIIVFALTGLIALLFSYGDSPSYDGGYGNFGAALLAFAALCLSNICFYIVFSFGLKYTLAWVQQWQDRRVQIAFCLAPFVILLAPGFVLHADELFGF